MLTPLDAASVALVESLHAAKVIATADAGRRGTLVHAYACRFDPARQHVTAILARSQSTALLESLCRDRRVALVVCDIATYQTVQLKGFDAEVLEPTDADRQAAIDYCAGFVNFSITLGFPRAPMTAHMECRTEDAIGVGFTVSQAFVQTPGPTAGQPLGVRP